MNNDTPRVNAISGAAIGTPLLTLARELEREISAIKDEFQRLLDTSRHLEEKLDAANQQLAAVTKERDEIFSNQRTQILALKESWHLTIAERDELAAKLKKIEAAIYPLLREKADREIPLHAELWEALRDERDEAEAKLKEANTKIAVLSEKELWGDNPHGVTIKAFLQIQDERDELNARMERVHPLVDALQRINDASKRYFDEQWSYDPYSVDPNPHKQASDALALWNQQQERTASDG